jgi:hypothetical protein
MHRTYPADRRLLWNLPAPNAFEVGTDPREYFVQSGPTKVLTRLFRVFPGAQQVPDDQRDQYEPEGEQHVELVTLELAFGVMKT